MIMAAIVDIEKCDGCGACMEVCPLDAIKLACPVGAEHSSKEVAVIDEDACTECGVCVEECPNGALHIP
jgi:electron transport complex protein RnfB